MKILAALIASVVLALGYTTPAGAGPGGGWSNPGPYRCFQAPCP